MTIARMRAEAEEIYAQRLADIPTTVDKIPNGFSRDDGASVRKVSSRPFGWPKSPRARPARGKRNREGRTDAKHHDN